MEDPDRALAVAAQGGSKEALDSLVREEPVTVGPKHAAELRAALGLEDRESTDDD